MLSFVKGGLDSLVLRQAQGFSQISSVEDFEFVEKSGREDSYL